MLLYFHNKIDGPFDLKYGSPRLHQMPNDDVLRPSACLSENLNDHHWEYINLIWWFSLRESSTTGSINKNHLSGYFVI